VALLVVVYLMRSRWRIGVGVALASLAVCTLGWGLTHFHRFLCRKDMTLPQYPRKGSNEKIHCVRFADDFIVTGKSKEVLENEVKPFVEQFMKERGLTLSQEKTLITHRKNGFDFLGQYLRTYSGKRLMKPSQKNIQTFLAGIQKVNKENKRNLARTSFTSTCWISETKNGVFRLLNWLPRLID